MTADGVRGWYAGRRVVVLGGLGFIGANLSRSLLDHGAHVTIVTRSCARYAAAARALSARGAAIVEADLRDAASWPAVLPDSAAVFQMAGRSGAIASMEEPRLDLDVNCAGTLALLDAVRSESPTAKIVVPGSRLQYGRAATLPVGEDHPQEPLCIHGVHKAAVEQYLHVYRHAYGLRFTAFRLTNPYGPGQPRERVAFGVINRLVHLAVAGQTLTIFGDGSQLRDYVFIDDVVNGLLLAGADAATDGKVYNLGSGVGTPLVDVARGICDAAGSGTVAFAPWPSLTGQIETGDFVADVTRFVTDTGWRPCVDLRQGLRRTVDACRAG